MGRTTSSDSMALGPGVAQLDHTRVSVAHVRLDDPLALPDLTETIMPTPTANLSRRAAIDRARRVNILVQEIAQRSEKLNRKLT